MAYEKNTWSPGDRLTSSGLNHIEDGLEEVTLKQQQGVDSPVVYFDLDDILDDYDNNGFSISNFTDILEEGKNIVVTYKISDGGTRVVAVTSIDYFILPLKTYHSDGQFIFRNVFSNIRNENTCILNQYTLDILFLDDYASQIYLVKEEYDIINGQWYTETIVSRGGEESAT